MTDSITMYWLPHCTTCRKADEYLKERGRTPDAYRDLKAAPLTREEVVRLAELVGGAGELFSRRARKHRSMGLHERELADDEMLDLMTGEYTFIKRPVLVTGERAVAGFTPKTYDRLLNQT